MDTDAFAALDEWCMKRAARVSEQAQQHIRKGKSLTAPDYRTLLGEHRAYLAMRSFIHGSLLSASPKHLEEPLNGSKSSLPKEVENG